jgi:hypothetical protein
VHVLKYNTAAAASVNQQNKKEQDHTGIGAYLLVRFELFFNFVLPNFVCANVAVVKSTGSCRPRNVDVVVVLDPLLPPPPPLLPPLPFPFPALPPLPLLPLPHGLLFLYMGLVDDVGEESLGEPFGLKVMPLSDELKISIGRKHCASGLNVDVTSRSALLSSGESCFCSE